MPQLGELMNRDDQTEARPFLGARPPGAPEELRSRTLAAAATEFHRRSHCELRAWANWPLRIAWAAAVVLLLVGHLVVPGPPVVSEHGLGLATAAPARGLDPELMEIVELPRISEASLTALP